MNKIIEELEIANLKLPLGIRRKIHSILKKALQKERERIIKIVQSVWLLAENTDLPFSDCYFSEIISRIKSLKDADIKEYLHPRGEK